MPLSSPARVRVFQFSGCQMVYFYLFAFFGGVSVSQSVPISAVRGLKGCVGSSGGGPLSHGRRTTCRRSRAIIQGRCQENPTIGGPGSEQGSENQETKVLILDLASPAPLYHKQPYEQRSFPCIPPSKLYLPMFFLKPQNRVVLQVWGFQGVRCELGLAQFGFISPCL